MRKKILKIICLTAVFVFLCSLFLVSSSAIGSSWGVNGYTATSTMPLKSIRVNDTRGIYSQYDDNADLYFCLADYMQYTRMQDQTRYSIQVPPYPQVNGNPGSTINNFMVYNNVYENNGYYGDWARVYCDNSILPYNSNERYYVNPFNSKVIQFKFDDFAIFDDQDDLAYGSYWYYYDSGIIDYYTISFGVKGYDENGLLTNDILISLDSDTNRKFSHDEFDRADAVHPNLVALFDYYNFNQVIGDVGTYGYYVYDLTFTVYHNNVASGADYTEFGGYNSSLTRDSDKSSIDYFIAENVREKIIYEGIGDLSLTDWLVTAVGGFFDFEIVQGITLGGVLYIFVGIGILFFLLKFLL